jgi:D-alanyl-D-alanine dipeptidase
MNSATAVAQRLDQARKLLRQEEVGLMLVWPSADLRYLTGYAGHASERPKLLALSADGPAVVIAPQLEAPGLEGVPGVQVRAFGETEDPYRLLSDLFEDTPHGARVAVSDGMWAAVLLRFQQTYSSFRYLPVSPIMRQLRMLKSADELELLRQAGAKADAAFEAVIQLRFAGRTERGVADELDALLRAQGLLRADWGPTVASGPNGASPHHLTGEREIHEGDAVVLDFGGMVDGYQADITRTVYVGTPEGEFRHVYELVKQAQEAGVRAVRPDAPAQSVDQTTRGVIAAAGYGDFFVHRTGHGVGLEVHEEPYIVEGNTLALQPGMTFSVEPGVYLPGRFGVRIEDVVAVTPGAALRLNNAPRELTVVH